MNAQEAEVQKLIPELKLTEEKSATYLIDSTVQFIYPTESDSVRTERENWKYHHNNWQTESSKMVWFIESNSYDSTRRSVTKRDDQSSLKSLILYYPNDDGVLEQEARFMFEYNNDKQMTHDIKHLWNSESDAWYPDVKHEYEYNDSSNPIRVTSFVQALADPTQWQTSTKTESFYDDDSRLIEERTYSMQSETGWHWNTISKITYNENENSTLTLKYYIEPTTQEHILNKRKTMKYNDANKMLQHLEQQYNQDMEEWVNIREYINEYNEQGLLIHNSSKFYYYLTGNCNWGTYYDYTWQEDSNISSKHEKIWDTDLQQWVNTYYSEYSHSNEALYKSIHKKQWNTETEQWNNFTILDSYKHSNEVPSVDIRYIQDNQNQWILDYKLFYYGRPINSTYLDEYAFNEKPLAYPNPATDCIRFYKPLAQGELIEIYSMSGQLILMQPALEGQIQLQLRNIPAGVYVLKLNKGGEIQSQKLIVE